jgi:hypothetical protein
MVRLAMRLLLGLESLFFVVLGIALAAGMIGVGSSRSLALVVAGLVLVDGILLALVAWQALRGHRLVDRGAFLLVIANAILSVTDEIGALDLVSLVLNVVLAVLLILGMRHAAPRASGTTDSV